MKRVLLPLHGYVGWNGGLDLVRLLVSSMRSGAAAEDIELHVAFPQSPLIQKALVSTLRRWREWLADKPPLSGGNQSGLRRTARELIAGLHVHDCADSASGILAAARASNADVIFPTMIPLQYGGIRRVGYIFDFQHRYVPDLFPARIRRNRDRQFSRLAASSDGVVVNSRTVAHDVVEFLGFPREAILAMPFTPYALPWWFDIDPMLVKAKYGVENPYLLVCNHFWKHKDHATAFEAFARLGSSCRDLQLVMTGDPIDHRDPKHFGRLVDLAKSLGIHERLHFLGLIPKAHQIALLRGCRLLVQPTLFEGGPGGGAVYEAVGMNIPSIVSDIPVNREADFGPIKFFRAGDANDLAAKILEGLDWNVPIATPETCIANGRDRLERLGVAIDSFLSQVIQRDGRALA